MFKHLVLATALFASVTGVASAAPIDGSFSFAGFSGSFVSTTSTTPTAQNATGLDFGAAFSTSGAGNGYGTNGTALVANGTGSFMGLNGATASIADIALNGTVGNPYQTNPFISFGTASNIQLNFSNATVTRSSTGTSVTVAGAATYTDGIAADTTSGMFSISANSQGGNPASLTFTFTGNSSASANVPEPMSLALLGSGLLGCGIARLKRRGA